MCTRYISIFRSGAKQFNFKKKSSDTCACTVVIGQSEKKKEIHLRATKQLIIFKGNVTSMTEAHHKNIMILYKLFSFFSLESSVIGLLDGI